MPNKHCAYGECKSDSRRQQEGITFHRFPNGRWHVDRCAKWVKACKRVGFTVKNVTRFTYICSLHFHGGKGPTPEYPDPIPASASTSEDPVPKSRNRKRLKKRRKSPDPMVPKFIVFDEQQVIPSDEEEDALQRKLIQIAEMGTEEATAP